MKILKKKKIVLWKIYSFLLFLVASIIAITDSLVIAVAATAANGSLRRIAELKGAGFNY